MEKIVGLDVTKKLVIPFDLPIENTSFVPSTAHLTPSKSNNDNIKKQNEDCNNSHTLNNTSKVVQEPVNLTHDAEDVNNQEQKSAHDNVDVMHQESALSSDVGQQQDRRTKRRLNFNSFDNKSAGNKPLTHRQPLQSMDLNTSKNTNNTRASSHQIQDSGTHNYEAMRHLQSISHRRESAWSVRAKEIIESRKRSSAAIHQTEDNKENHNIQNRKLDRVEDDAFHTPERRSGALKGFSEVIDLYKDDNRSASDAKTVFSFL